MASVSPSSSVSRVTRGVRAGLEVPLAPSSILGDVSAIGDVGAKLRVVEAYYLALAKYYDATVAIASEECGGASQRTESELNVSAISVASSARSRRRRRRRIAESKVREGEGQLEFEAEPDLSYLLLVREDCRFAARVELGQRPTVGRLVACPAEWFKTGLALSEVRCSVSSDMVQFSGSGDFEVASLFSHVAAGYRTPRGAFGALWPACVQDWTVTKETLIGRVSVGVSNVEDGFLVAGFDRVDLHQPVGYCYLEFVKSSCRTAAMELLGPEPGFASVLQVPLEMCDVAKLEVGADCLPGGRVHVHEHGQYAFGSVAATVASSSGAYCFAGSLGAYVVGRFGIVQGLRVGVDAVLGALPMEVMNMLEMLAGLSGLQVSDFSQDDSVIAVKTAALLDASSKDRLKMLEAVGDCALSMVIAQEAAGRGETAQEYQAARSLLSNNNHLAELFVQSGLVDHVQFVANVPKKGKVGAGCFEAMVALVYNAGSIASVRRMCCGVGFFSAYQAWSSVDLT